MPNLKVIPICAFKDNYIWLITNTENNYGVIVDPGDAEPVLKKLNELKIKLTAILITHHHNDHCGGIAELVKHYTVPVFGPAHEKISTVTHPLSENDEVELFELKINLRVLDIPGHTIGHIAYYGEDMLFCGDTLFTAGCGRVFEGTPKQMYESLAKLKNLPDKTTVYCGHEYTLANLRFAQAVESNNAVIKKRIEICTQLRAQNLPTVPAKLSEEKQTNPFLRCREVEVIAAAEKYADKKLNTPAEVFAAVRQWKNEFI